MKKLSTLSFLPLEIVEIIWLCYAVPSNWTHMSIVGSVPTTKGLDVVPGAYMGTSFLDGFYFLKHSCFAVLY